MLPKVVLLFILQIVLYGCRQEKIPSPPKTSTNATISESPTPTTNILGNTIEKRFAPPSQYTRLPVTPNSFAHYLRNLKLKPIGSKVHYYNGRVKNSNHVYEAVIDLEIGHKDLHQCADAVMRLRAEYLWYQEKYDDIHFNFTNGHKVEYSEWRKGRRMKVEGNKTYWDDSNKPSNTYESFWNYLELIFTYAGTASLEKELTKVDIKDMQIGDVLIQGGYPGHAVIVLDMATDESTEKKVYLLGQSYMPAQELQVLKNNAHPEQSPWYTLSGDPIIDTPEWQFDDGNLRRFEN